MPWSIMMTTEWMGVRSHESGYWSMARYQDNYPTRCSYFLNLTCRTLKMIGELILALFSKLIWRTSPRKSNGSTAVSHKERKELCLFTFPLFNLNFHDAGPLFPATTITIAKIWPQECILLALKGCVVHILVASYYVVVALYIPHFNSWRE
jgi:hypothetical protein